MLITAEANEQLAKLLHTSELSPIRAAFHNTALHNIVEPDEPTGGWLGKKLVDDGVLSGVELARVLANELNVPLIDLLQYHPQADALSLLDQPFCEEQFILPLRLADDTLEIAMANPFDTDLIEIVKFTTRHKVAVFVAPIDAILDEIPTFYTHVTVFEPASSISLPALAPPVIYRSLSAHYSGPDEPPYPHSIFDILIEAHRLSATDVQLSAGAVPRVRVNGRLTLLSMPKLRPRHVYNLANSLMTPAQQEVFLREWELDFSFAISDLDRYRANIYLQRGSHTISLRVIPSAIPSLTALGMPQVLRTFAALEHGLVLITGPTGSGKSTTMAAIIDEMNHTRHSHIITLEDPIEYVHTHQKCIIDQREIGTDSKTFHSALTHALRQDSDVILIGEMRDLETIATAITAAETGHTVLASLHTNSAPQSIDRILDIFPADQQPQIRLQLSSVLEGIVCQRLMPRIDGVGLVCAQEILVATPAVRALIREGKTHQIASMMEAGARFGMQSMDKALHLLRDQKRISHDEAIRNSIDAEAFDRSRR